MGPDAALTLRNNVTFADQVARAPRRAARAALTLVQQLTYTEFAAYLERCAPNNPAEDAEPLYYGKDLVPPTEWVDTTRQHLPAWLNERQDNDVLGVVERPPETLMVYIGVNGTHTCGHFDLCASLGHNLLLASDPGPTSIWYVIRTQDREAAKRFWEFKGGTLFADNSFLPASMLRHAPFPVYVVFQGEGDLVLVPPMSAHQVFNKGRNVKISWNRLPPRSVELGYFHVLPEYRLVGRPETYRLVELAYRALGVWAAQLQQVSSSFLSEAIATNPLPTPQIASLRPCRMCAAHACGGHGTAVTVECGDALSDSAARELGRSTICTDEAVHH